MRRSVSALFFVAFVAWPLAAQWTTGAGTGAGTVYTDDKAGISPDFSDTNPPFFQLEVGKWWGRPTDIVSGIAPLSGASIAGDVFAGNVPAASPTPTPIGRARMSSNGAQGFLQWNLYYTGTGLSRMDSAKPGYELSFNGITTDSTNPDYDGATIRRYKLVSGVLTRTSLLSIDKDGNVSASGTINANYQDVAEWVPGAGELPPGTVVVLDRSTSNQVIPSASAYDAAVAGVISERPGLLLGTAGDSKARVATVGRVKVRVDASKRAVSIGDLLVTSDKAGMAMVSEPVDINGLKLHRPGTLIGKALEPLASGEGEVLVLLSLQ